jgi:hypothetical protein
MFSACNPLNTPSINCAAVGENREKEKCQEFIGKKNDITYSEIKFSLN